VLHRKLPYQQLVAVVLADENSLLARMRPATNKSASRLSDILFGEGAIFFLATAYQWVQTKRLWPAR
jgi:hypothetical protein